MDDPKAILFDLDDTIVAYDCDVDVCWRTVCDRFACRSEGCGSDRMSESIRVYSDWFWSDPARHREGRLRLNETRREIVEEALRRIGIKNAALAADIAADYVAQRYAMLRPFTDAIETLESLQARGVRMALITNGEAAMQQEKIDRFGLARFFDCIVIEGAFGYGKPEPHGFLYALDCLNAMPEQAWMVGDNLTADIAGAQSVGIYTVWHDYKGTGLPDGCSVRPDRIIRTIKELVED